MPPPTDLPRGLDVASYQGNPDWDAVAGAGYAFAFTKATEATDYTNPTFRRNWAEIRRAGMIRGCYHYARLERGNSATDEADYFYAAVLGAGGLQAGDLLALDLEPGVTVHAAGAWCMSWLERIERLAGFKPLVYTGPWVIAQQGLAGTPELGEYGLWLASYQAAMPAAPAPWQFVAFWQYSATGKVPGIVGNVDLNVFNGPADRIALYGKPGAIVEPPKPAPSDADTIGGLRVAVAHLADVVCEIEDRPARLAKAREIREQFVGPRP